MATKDSDTKTKSGTSDTSGGVDAEGIVLDADGKRDDVLSHGTKRQPVDPGDAGRQSEDEAAALREAIAKEGEARKLAEGASLADAKNRDEDVKRSNELYAEARELRNKARVPAPD